MRKNRLDRIYLFFLFLLISPPIIFSQDSILQTLDESLRSIVKIKAESAIMGKKPETAFLDKETGKILILKRAKAAKFDRNGAGVVIDSKGIIVTNAHVVKKAGRTTVTFHDNTELDAQVVWVDSKDDIAFLKVNAEAALKPLSLADSNSARLRDIVYTVGNSEFIQGTIAQGRITGIGKNDKTTQKVDMIQTNFNIYKGDSGGPLLNEKGQLLGMLIAAKTTQNHISFAIPSSNIKKHYQNYIKKTND